MDLNLDVMRAGARALARRLEEGEDVSVLERGGERVLRVEWLNLYNEPSILYAIAGCILWDSERLGLNYDAVVSIETSGAKYGVALALLSSKPYFSLHKVEKIVFENPISAESYSVTESTPTRLYVDRSVATRFRRIILVDDIRRSSRTINTAVELLEKSMCVVEACYVVLDLAFAGHPPPQHVHYRPLYVIDDVDEDGRAELGGGICLEL